MKKLDQATPRPWEAEHTHIEMYGTKPIKRGWHIMHRNKPFEIDRDDFEMVVGLNGFEYNGSHEKIEANARLIVTAVNCHDELTNALKAMVHYYGECTIQCQGGDIAPCVHKLAKQALSKAQGGE